MQSSKTGCLKTFFRIVFLTNILFTVSGTNVEDTIKYCCNLGTNYASSGLKCSEFQPPIAGINAEDEKFCISSVDVCCKKQYRELECEAGKYDAKAKKDCTSSNDGTEFKKECCEACKLGIDTGSSGQASSCQVSFGFGAPADSAFTTCCQESSPANLLSTTPPTTTVTPATTPRVSRNTLEEPDSYDSIPPLENLCDIGEICAHICIPTGNSFRCECNKGFVLMDDGTSCKPLKTIAHTNTGNKKTPNRCEQNNPCDHICTDTGVAIKCSCNEGYVLESDKLTCTDIDECATGEFECGPGEECVNGEGGYYCEYSDDSLLGGEDAVFDKCPEGYKFNGEKSVCDDIDECEFGIMCPRPKTCINTVGSFKCEGEELPQCPPGFYYKPAIDTCADIDECLSGENDCNKESQICLNTKGNYTCIDKASKNKCPAGFKKNPYTQICEDIDECLENSEVCDRDETCINEPSGYKCVPNSLNNIIPTQTEVPSTVTYPTTTPTTRTTSKTTTTTQRTPRVQNRYNVCSKGFRYSADADRCVDVDECKEDSNACDSAQECYNAQGSYVCQCKNGYNKDFQTGACIDINECQIGKHDCSIGQRCDNTIGSYICARIAGCGTGYTLNYASGLCEDDDECALGTHNCHGLGPTFRCRNTLGSYRCDPIRTTTSTTTTTTTSTTTTTTPRSVQFIPYTTLPTYPVYPKRCLPGYQLSAEGVCEDLDECVMGTHRCNDYGNNLECRNTIGSYVCEPSRRITTTQATTPRIIPFRPVPPDSPIITQRKRCLPGYRMNALGQCEDIDECQSNPCGPGQKCLNFNGRYQCLSNLQCKYGYELNEVGDKCVDVNECARGTHKCTPSQICKNGEGYYICECPPGHHMPRGSTLCEDINECQTFYRVCPLQADCINTIGSYECRCKDGFKETENSCVDIDECKESPGLCEHNCVNTWGSYRCACMPGFTLNSDNRTCTDVDECVKFKDRKLCVGTCENVPGSYTCKCPKGYRLGDDGRTCRDIDECENNVCPRPNDICLNTRGSYKCFTLTCPPNYYRDPSHKSRCKRAQNICDFRDLSCTQLPDQYTSHYISFSSLLPVTHGPIPFFQIKGPHWGGSRVEFTMEIGDVQCPLGVERITENNFRMVRSAQNSLQLAIIRPLQGPQEAQLIVKMFIYHSDIVTTHVVFYIYIVVSEYEF